MIRSFLCAVPVGEGDPLYRELEAIWRHRCGLLHVVGLPLGPILFAPHQAIDITCWLTMAHNAHPIRGFVSSCGWVVAPPPWRRGPQVRAPWHHGGHGAVDVVGPVAPPGHACSCGDAGVYTDRPKWPLGAVLGRLCTLLGCGAVADGRGDAGVYTDRREWPLRAVLGHLCTLLRHESRYESQRE